MSKVYDWEWDNPRTSTLYQEFNQCSTCFAIQESLLNLSVSVMPGFYQSYNSDLGGMNTKI